MTAPPGPDPGDAPPIEVRTRFERFPASIKGAFVARGADGNPHGIRFDWAVLARVPGGGDRPVPLEDRMLDVAPSRDLFVPFEASLADLEPGWYQVRSSVRVDAGQSMEFTGTPFAIPWTRNEVRRGTIPVDRKVSAGGGAFELVRVELQTDSAVVAWRSDRPGRGDEGGGTDAETILLADGEAVDRLPDDAVPVPRSADQTERRSAFYPLLRSTRSAGLLVRLGTGEESESVPLSLI